jgi:hypothetical protein
MANQQDVRRIALSLAGVVEDEKHFGFSLWLKGKRHGLVWAWNERLDPKKPRVPSTTVVAVRVTDLSIKQELLAADESVFFTEDHYQGYPAVLIRLPAISTRRLRGLITDAWQAQPTPTTRQRPGRTTGAKGKRKAAAVEAPAAKAKPRV